MVLFNCVLCDKIALSRDAGFLCEGTTESAPHFVCKDDFCKYVVEATVADTGPYDRDIKNKDGFMLCKSGKLPCPLFDLENPDDGKCDCGHIHLADILAACLPRVVRDRSRGGSESHVLCPSLSACCTLRTLRCRTSLRNTQVIVTDKDARTAHSAPLPNHDPQLYACPVWGTGPLATRIISL